jgi:hypothetical protein
VGADLDARDRTAAGQLAGPGHRFHDETLPTLLDRWVGRWSSPAGQLGALSVSSTGRVEQAVRRDADVAGELSWAVQADSSVVRAHRHAAGARKRGLTPKASAAQQGWAAPQGGLSTKIHEARPSSVVARPARHCVQRQNGWPAGSA